MKTIAPTGTVHLTDAAFDATADVDVGLRIAPGDGLGLAAGDAEHRSSRIPR